MAKKKPAPTPAWVEALADHLFTNGMGQLADRLVLYDVDDNNLGGWCRSAVVDAINKFAPATLPASAAGAPSRVVGRK